jgi:hypothetical protein
LCVSEPTASRQKAAANGSAARSRKAPRRSSPPDSGRHEGVTGHAQSTGQGRKDIPVAAEEGREKEKAARIANASAASSRRATASKGGKGGSYCDWSKQDLLKQAKKIGIKGRSAMNKKQLVNALRNH